MSFTSLLHIEKFVSRVDVPFLAEYLERLPLLHPTYQGLLLPSSPIPQKGKAATEEVFALMECGASARKDAVCQHEAEVNAKCDGFEWEFSFERFSIHGSAFRDVIGMRLDLDDDFVSAYGTETAFMSEQAPLWIEQGFCDEVSDSGSLFLGKSTAWAVYLSAKDQHRYPSTVRLYSSLLDHWGEYPEGKRAQVAELLDILRPRILSYHPELFIGNSRSREYQEDRRTFVRYADERLVRDLGEETFGAMLSEFDISLDQWRVAGEPKPANYSVGGIWVPSPA